MRSFGLPAFQSFSAFCALALLWFRLIDHLRIEWSVNPQYGYGWAVPFLCGFLVWRAAKGRLPCVSEGPLPSAKPGWLFWLAAVLYLPTRLVQEANPEWRLVSWALALEVLTLTIALAGATSAVQVPKPPAGTLAFSLQPLAFVWPLAFFLVAVPWPTVIEGPVVQALTRADTVLAAEAVDLLGVPALQHGNSIQVGTGMVQVDEACSGIRSFQVSLMLSLFFGEVYRLNAARRLWLCAVAFAGAFLLNVLRTALLTWVAGTKGAGAMELWHEPAGTAILVAGFGGIWAFAWGSRRPESAQKLTDETKGNKPAKKRPWTLDRELPTPPFRFGTLNLGLWTLIWLLGAEAGTEIWYRMHETRLPAPTLWSFKPPQENATLRTLPFAERTRRFLRYDEGMNVSWREGDVELQAIFLRWNAGRTAVHLARTHTPEACVTAGGRKLISKSELRLCNAAGLQLPFRCYVFEDSGGPLHVYYCLWEDRAVDRRFDSAGLTYQNRLAPVVDGRRLCGQRSFELAVWGCPDQGTAEQVMQRQIENVLRPEEEDKEQVTRNGGEGVNHGILGIHGK